MANLQTSSDFDAPGETDEFDAAHWHSKDDQRAEHHSQANERPLGHRPATRLSQSLSIPQDVPEQAGKMQTQRSSRLPPLSKKASPHHEPSPSTKAGQKKTKPSRARGHGSDVGSFGQPQEAVPTSQPSRSQRAPTALEREEARAKADRLTEELELSWHNRAEKVQKKKDIQRQTVIANGGWIDCGAEPQPLATEPLATEESKPHRGTVKAPGKRVRDTDIDDCGYRPGEKDELRERYAHKATHDDEIDLEGNPIPRKRMRESAVKNGPGEWHTDEYAEEHPVDYREEFERAEDERGGLSDAGEDERVSPPPRKHRSRPRGDTEDYYGR